MKGVFISFEGADGSGKSTQIKLLSDYCKEKGLDVLQTREPGGTQISEKIRNIILDPDNTEMGAATEALLYASSRAQLVEEVIKPALSEGKIVLCDRFMDSSIAYQGYARKLGDGVRLINEFAIQSLQPNLTFFLDLDPKEGRERNVVVGKKDRMEKEELTFHQDVYKGYKKLAEIYKDRYVNIDASKSVEEVFQEIKKVFDNYISK